MSPGKTEPPVNYIVNGITVEQKSRPMPDVRWYRPRRALHYHLRNHRAPARQCKSRGQPRKRCGSPANPARICGVACGAVPLAKNFRPVTRLPATSCIEASSTVRRAPASGASACGPALRKEIGAGRISPLWCPRAFCPVPNYENTSAPIPCRPAGMYDPVSESANGMARRPGHSEMGGCLHAIRACITT